MRPVSIVGIGQTPVGKWPHRSLAELAVASLRAAMHDAGADRLDGLYAGSMLAGMLCGQGNLGAIIAGAAGLTGIEAVTVDAACGAGGAALHVGVMAVASGMCDVVAVTGVEKMTGEPLPRVLAGLATAADAQCEVAEGITFAGLNALVMRRYMYEYSWRHEHFAAFSVNAHRNAQTNNNAMFRRGLTLEQYRQGRVIADPVTLYDASPICDGAATVILCPTALAEGFARTSVRVTASAVATDTPALQHRDDILWPRALVRSAQAAYRQAGRSPRQIDLFEVHDAFSSMAAISLEAAGFAERGQGVRLAQDGAIALNGSIPISTMGGLKARGHPVGASGVYQAVEAVMQLRGEAGANQVADARVALIQSVGGTGAVAVTHILEA